MPKDELLPRINMSVRPAPVTVPGGGWGGDASTLGGYSAHEFARLAEDCIITGTWTFDDLLLVEQYIKHAGDLDTLINFQPDQFQVEVDGYLSLYLKGGAAADGCTFLGLGGGSALDGATGSTGTGASAGESISSGSYNTVGGYRAGSMIDTTAYNTIYGADGMRLGKGSANTGIGAKVLENVGATSEGFYHTAAGYRALNAMDEGDYCVAVGADAMRLAQASYSVGIGYQSLEDDGKTSGGGSHVGVGYQTLKDVDIGTGDVAIGYGAGSGLTSGSGCVFIGYLAGSQETIGSNKLYIENSNSAEPLIYGEFDNNLIKIYGTVESTVGFIVEQVGTPTYKYLQDWINTTQSAGLISGGTITATSYAIATADEIAETFTVSGDMTAYFTNGVVFTVSGSTGNDGDYTTVGNSTYAGGVTTITVADVPDGTDDGNIADGRVDVAVGTGMVKKTDDEIDGVTPFFDWPANTNVALIDNSVNWLYATYGGGTPAVAATDTYTNIDHTTEHTIGRVYREGTTLHILNSGTHIYNAFRREHRRIRDLRRVERATGAVISDEGTLKIKVTAAVLYSGIDKLTTSEVDTSGAGRFRGWYHDALGDWTSTGTPADQTDIDSANYDTGTGLAALAANRYGVYWVFLDFDGHVHVVYGRASYKLQEAQAAAFPAVPDICSEFSVLVARIIAYKDAAEITAADSAFEYHFLVTTPADHDDLANVTANQHHNEAHVADSGGPHTGAGLTAGHVLRASAADAFAFAELQHADLGGVTSDLHHNEIHVANSTGPHAEAGLTAGHVLRASAAAAFAFAELQHDDLGGVGTDDHHNEAHVVDSGGPHTGAGLTIGHVLRASGAAAFAFAELQHDDLGGVGVDDHHAQIHNVVGGDHTLAGAQWVLVGATALNTIGLLTPSANVSAGAEAILKSTAAGDLALHDLTATGQLSAGAGIAEGIILGADAQWYRSAADVMRTPDSVTVDVGVNVGIATGAPAGTVRGKIATGNTAWTIETDDGYVGLALDGARTTDVTIAQVVFQNAGDTVAGIYVVREGANDAAHLDLKTQAAGGATTTGISISSVGNVTTVGDLLVANGKYIGISAAERLQFNAAGTIQVLGADVLIGTEDGGGKLNFDEGTTIATGIVWGSDVNKVTLYRSADDTLKTDDHFQVGFGRHLKISATGNVEWSDVNLYRRVGDVLKTDDSLEIALGLNVGTATGAGTGQLSLSDDIIMANGKDIGIGSAAERLEFYTAGYIAAMGCKFGIGVASPGTILDMDSGAAGESDSDTSAVRVTGQASGMAYGLILRHEDAGGGQSDSGEGMGIRFDAWDGSAFQPLAIIAGRADGQAVASGDGPGKIQFYTTADGGNTLTLGMVLNKGQALSVVGCVSDGTCEIFTEDALGIIEDILSKGTGKHDEHGHERMDMRRIHGSYPFLIQRQDMAGYGKPAKIDYFDRLGAKSDLLYRAVMQLSERLAALEAA